MCIRDSARPIATNFPRNELKKKFIKSYLDSPKISQETQRQIKVIAMIFIIPVIL